MANSHDSTEPVAWAVYWGLPPTRQNSVHFDKESAQAVANQIKSATEVRPLYAAPVAQQPQAEKHATMAGLESSINILSSLVDEQRQLLAEVDAVFGVDAHGIVLEDGDSALIDRVRAHLAATSEAKQPQAEPDMRKVCEALGFDPTNHHNAAKCPYCRGQQPQADLLAAAEEFCRKVEAGEARSTKSYAAFKSAIEQIEKQPQAEVVPPGYVLVPVELLCRVLDSEEVSAMADASDELRAMIDAAIAQQKGGV